MINMIAILEGILNIKIFLTKIFLTKIFFIQSVKLICTHRIFYILKFNENMEINHKKAHILRYGFSMETRDSFGILPNKNIARIIKLT